VSTAQPDSTSVTAVTAVKRIIRFMRLALDFY
jgi:hypothetical protein